MWCCPVQPLQTLWECDLTVIQLQGGAVFKVLVPKMKGDHFSEIEEAPHSLTVKDFVFKIAD